MVKTDAESREVMGPRPGRWSGAVSGLPMGAPSSTALVAGLALYHAGSRLPVCGENLQGVQSLGQLPVSRPESDTSGTLKAENTGIFMV